MILALEMGGNNQFTYDGKSNGSESGGRSEWVSTRLRGVLVGEELGNANGELDDASPGDRIRFSMMN